MAATPLGTVLQHLRRLADGHRVAGLGDAQLLERFVRQRDEAAFAALLERHGPMVFGVCKRLLRDLPQTSCCRTVLEHLAQGRDHSCRWLELTRGQSDASGPSIRV